MGPSLKLCTRCERHIPFWRFGSHPHHKDGLQIYCKECINSYRREKYRADKAWSDKVKATNRLNWADNAVEWRKTVAKWRVANKAKMNALSKKYKHSKRKAMPKWANQQKIEEFYFAADFLGMVTGEWHHVDHVVPLQSDVVCGLHCEGNLQVLTATENLRKSNLVWPGQ
jgi:hypothetical protein